MKVAISGSRTFTETRIVRDLVAGLVKANHKVLFGDAPRGVDRMVRTALEGIPDTAWTRFDADWETEGRSAGHRRNARMLKDAEMLIAIFAPGDRTPGTSGAVRIALAKGIPVRIYHEGKWTNGYDA